MGQSVLSATIKNTAICVEISKKLGGGVRAWAERDFANGGLATCQSTATERAIGTGYHFHRLPLPGFGPV